MTRPALERRRDAAVPPVQIPADKSSVSLKVLGTTLKLTNLRKVFWPEGPITKRDLLQYYADMADCILPHLVDRAMVMKRFPAGAYGEHFFQKRAPEQRPESVDVCPIAHRVVKTVEFPLIHDLSGLLWMANLGCIDMNPWYGRCDHHDRPDYLHFDLDPTPGANFDHVREAALLVRDALLKLKIKSYPKTTGSRGIHIYVPIVRGPLQKEVWTFAKALAKELEAAHGEIITAEYRIAKRPGKRVLVDYNQNAWGRTLASVYSVRPRPHAPVSAPVTWDEVERGIQIEDFRLDNMPGRVARLGDLYRPLLLSRGRVNLTKFL